MTCSANEETVITAEQTASVVEKLKSVVELDPKVIKDVNTVAEKFPCHDFVYGILLTLVSKSIITSEFILHIGGKITSILCFFMITDKSID